ncbi:hypothetical protein ACTHP3_05255 [Shouchella rhizosphaerae]|uniref:hypothetical protein n=1 Tax=Shouchella rhizosphaerae TaxID=866786 RepID=UPI003F81C8C7
MSQLTEEQKKNIESLQYENQKANSRIEFLATRLAQREIELSEMNAQLQTFKNAFEATSRELEEMKKDGENDE